VPNRVQGLDVVIDGKKYALPGVGDVALLALGDYHAELIQDEHKTTYESLQECEFLFPEKKPGSFTSWDSASDFEGIKASLVTVGSLFTAWA
jgi:hypothetical protein